MATLLDDFSNIDDLYQDHKPAELWRRTIAYFIDTVFITIVTSPIVNLASGDWGIALYFLLYYGGYILYGTYFESSTHQATLGKRLANIKVVSLDKGRLTQNEAFKRNVLKIILCIISIVMIITILVDDERRGLHDKSSNSKVVNASKE